MPDSDPRPRPTFPRERRMLTKRDYQAALKSGRRVRDRRLSLTIHRRDTVGPPRLGMAATRKLGNAVTRNRLKRLTREVFRHLWRRLEPGVDIVVWYYPEAVGAPLEDLRRSFEKLVQRACVIRDPQPRDLPVAESSERSSDSPDAS